MGRSARVGGTFFQPGGKRPRGGTTVHDLFADLERRFEDLRNDLFGRANAGSRMPACDLVDKGDAYFLTAELPGVDKKDIQVDVEDDAVGIRATRREAEEQKGQGWVRRERSSAAYERHFRLPERVSADGARATFRNGVLDLRLPKVEPEKRRGKRLEVD